MLDVSANDIALIVGCFTVGLLHGVFGLYSGLFALMDEFKDYKWWSVFSNQFRKKYMARARRLGSTLANRPATRPSSSSSAVCQLVGVTLWPAATV